MYVLVTTEPTIIMEMLQFFAAPVFDQSRVAGMHAVRANPEHGSTVLDRNARCASGNAYRYAL